MFWGGFNAASTYALYLLLASFIHYQLAYLVTYVAGIGLAYLVNLRMVFRSRSSGRKMALYPLIYVFQYFLGAALLFIFVDLLHVSSKLAPLLVIGMLFPLSYCLNKKLLSTQDQR